MQMYFKKIQAYAELVKFEHTVFALPFALSALLLASGHAWPSYWVVLWVILAMVGGRTYAMGLNRIIDVHIDAQNPRTQNRSLPAGRVTFFEAWALTLVALVVMIIATLQLPSLCFRLLPLAVFVLTIYSYVKRFSNLAHLVLGFALGSSAIGGWIAVTGQLTLPPILLGLAVLFWVAGFDIIYACQDYTFDRDCGLYSIPARWGLKTGLRLSRGCHGMTVLMLILLGIQLGASWFFWAGVLLVSLMLVYEQSLVSDTDLTRVNEAFFNLNGIISIGFWLLILLGKLFFHGLP